MRHKTIKQFALLLSLLLLTVWGNANDIRMMDGFSPIHVKEGNVQGTPKGSTIQASINGHMLTVTFTENLGEVTVEITSATGGYVQADSCLTPNGLMFYIPTGNYYIKKSCFKRNNLYFCGKN